jgi:rhodanese-related sulfurtransferase
MDASGKTFRPTSRGGWAVISNVLKDKCVRFSAPQEVVFARNDGLPLLDIRPNTQFKHGFIEGSKNVQFYRPIEGWDLWKVARRANFALFMTEGTEPNPEFLDEVRELVPDNRTPVTLMCNLGGHLDDYGPSPNGMQTRSLMAAYELLNAGYSDVRVLKGGIHEWSRQERELVQD